MMQWKPIETAPMDGTAILGYGRYIGSPSDARKGVIAGDHWWAIMVWSVWRKYSLPQPGRWVFAKDGAKTWSAPTHWMPLPEPPAQEITDETH